MQVVFLGMYSPDLPIIQGQDLVLRVLITPTLLRLHQVAVAVTLAPVQEAAVMLAGGTNNTNDIKQACGCL